MEQNFNNAINKLQDMLSTEEGKQDLENLMGSFGMNGGNAGGGDSGVQQNATGGLNLGNLNMDMLMNIRSVIDQVQNGSDPRSNLLNALKPYLSQSRYGHVDNAIKIMSLGRIPGAIKNMRK